MTEEIMLVRDNHTIPWGFRLTGGRDFNGPLTVVRIAGQSIAEKRGLRVGDIITEVNNEKTNNLCHNEAQRFIADGGNFLKLVVLRGSTPIIPPALTPVREMTCASLASNYEKKNTSSVISAESVYSLYEDDSFELLGQSDDEITEFHEPTEEEINQMLLENAEVIEEKGKNVIGVNFKRFIPKCEFIKDSAVFQVLQEEQVYKELSEKEQLQKTPNKRFSTFLDLPNRPVPEPKLKTESPPKNLVQKENNKEFINETNQDQVTKIKLENEHEVFNLNNTMELINKTENSEFSSVEKSQNIHDCVNQNVEENPNSNALGNNMNNQEEDLTETHKKNNEQNLGDSRNAPENEFVNQLAVIKNAMDSLKQLPFLIQLQLSDLQVQIDQLIQLKENETQGAIGSGSETMTIDESDFRIASTEKFEDDENAKLDRELDETANSDEDLSEQEQERKEDEQNHDSNPTDENSMKSDQSEEVRNEEILEKEQSISVDCTKEVTQKRRPACPLTPLPRPVVLPGGRIWRKPKDAFNEEFIAETLISQAEVLVGSTVGVNFRKYEPPKFDVSNSAVYKLVHNIESKKAGFADRDTIPSLQDYYQSPISSRHFYCANLATAKGNSSENGSSKDENKFEISSQV